MSWEHEMASWIKGNRPKQFSQAYLTGQVLSPVWSEEEEDWVGPLIVSILDGAAMLREEMLEQLEHGSRLHEGMRVALLPGENALEGGQRFLILGVMGDAV